MTDIRSANNWMQEVEPPRLLLLGTDWRPVAEVPFSTLEVNAKLNGGGGGQCEVYVGNTPELDPLLVPWQATLVLVHGSKVLWGGVVSKRTSPIGSPELKLALKEWSYWLEKVWGDESTEFDPTADTVDGGEVIKHRVEQALTLAKAGQLKPPLLRGGWAGPAGVQVDVSFHDQSEESSPKTFYDEIMEVAELGIDWHMPWVELPDGSYGMRLVTGRYDPNAPAVDVQVGADTAEAVLTSDGELQATMVKVVGADDVVAIRNAAPAGYPPLYYVKSYDQLGALAASDAQAEAQAASHADAILSRTKYPVGMVDTLDLPGLRDDHPLGGLIRMVVEEARDPRFPAGVSVLLRVQEIEYVLEPGAQGRTSPRRTVLSLGAPHEGLGNTPTRSAARAVPAGFRSIDPTPPITRLPPHDVVGYVQGLERRLAAVEARRAQARDTGWRVIKGTYPGVNYIRVRRIGNTVHVEWVGSWSWVNNSPVPAGFEPEGNGTGLALPGGVSMYSQSDWAGAGYPQDWRASLLYVQMNPAPHWKFGLPWFAGADALTHRGYGIYAADAPWPTTLPGQPV